MRRRGIGSCHRDQKKSNLDPVSFYFFSCFDRLVFCLDVAEFLFGVVVFYFNCFIGNCLGQYTQEKEIGTLLMEVGQWCCLVLLVVSNRNFLVPAIAAV